VKEYDNLLIVQESKFPWSNSKRFDLHIVNWKILVELDGEQHFTQVSNWNNPHLTQSNDIEKMRIARMHGYTTIRLLQEDVLYDKVDWKHLLREHLMYHDIPQIIYLSERYQHHHQAIMELYDTLL
jgi:hypothetical protein